MGPKITKEHLIKTKLKIEIKYKKFDRLASHHNRQVYV